MKFNKITETDLLNKGVLGLPDTPGLTTHDMQAKFDELVRDVMVPKFNALMDELSAIANIDEVTQTVKNTETSIPTGKAVTGYVADTQKNMALVPVFKSKGEFPEKGDTNRIYIDDTVSPRLLYTWSVEEGYVLTGGEGSSLIILPLTYAEYVALPEEEKMRDDVIYEITDRDYGVRFGESDISKIGDGSVTGAISELDYSKADASKKTTALDVEDVAYTSDIPEDADDGDAKISMIGGTTKKENVGTEEAPVYELRSAPVTEVESVGVNIFGGEALANKIMADVPDATLDASQKTVAYEASRISNKILFTSFKPDTQYTFILKGVNALSKKFSNLNIIYTDGTKDSLAFQTAGEVSICRLVSDVSKTIKQLSGLYNTGTVTLYYEECGIFEGVLTVDDFVPYSGDTLPIPEAVQSLDGYGDGISDTVYNYVDFEKKQFIKRVGKVDMGALNWNYSTNYTYPHFTTGVSGDNINFTSTDTILLCGEYREISGLPHSKFRIRDYDKCICNITDQIASLRLAVQDSAYTDVETFKNAMSGVVLYYELATPEIIDISNLLTDNLIPVEGGGTLTFKNEYEYAVPHKFTYYKTDIKIKGTAEKAVCDADGNDIAAKFKALEAELATLKTSLS